MDSFLPTYFKEEAVIDHYKIHLYV